MNLANFWSQGDLLMRSVAVLLLAMSVASWVIIVWKSWLLGRVQIDVPRAVAAFWQSASTDEATQKIIAFDREALILPMLYATNIEAVNTLESSLESSLQRTRRLREALHAALVRLQQGQVLLASVGATAPFVGLLGTVWGIYHALMRIASAGQVSIDKLAGPVGESLIMTAVGLMVAIPAVLAYNLLGRAATRITAELDGFAHDLCALHASTAATR